jgi:hypothetical protein
MDLLTFEKADSLEKRTHLRAINGRSLFPGSAAALQPELQPTLVWWFGNPLHFLQHALQADFRTNHTRIRDLRVSFESEVR